MSSCELCGRNPAEFSCEVEGTIMKVCQECSRFGKVKGKSNVRIVVQEVRKFEHTEPEYTFVNGYGMIVKNAREKLGLNQEDFAKKINEHKSIVHQIESEHMRPSIELARKFEKALHVKIVEEVKSEKYEADEDVKHLGPTGRITSKPTSEGLTLGDMISTKKR